MELLILLVAAHALCDIPLQGDYLSRAKRGCDGNFPAWLALFYHAVIHAGAVMLLTHSVPCALAELLIHYLTDASKCRGRIGAKLDQFIHLACKFLWAFVVLHGIKL